jgi:hypothetical protein
MLLSSLTLTFMAEYPYILSQNDYVIWFFTFTSKLMQALCFYPVLHLHQLLLCFYLEYFICIKLLL